MTNQNKWEAIIGLEIHVELNTKTKLFSRAPNRFGDEPNTNITEVCTGEPGALPVLNRAAVHKAVAFGCAVNAEVAHFSKFDRKSYFYPDNPRNFQITQFDQPIVLGGEIVTEVDGKEKTFKIDRAHLEDDAGTLRHFSSFVGVDYNRAGVPLLEIVSEPCLHSAKDAIAYAMMVRSIMQYVDASDCNMEEGSLRIDANISVRKFGEETLRNKTEIKNMNSFNFMGIAIDAEIKRQIHEYEINTDKNIEDVIEQATYRWDPEKMAIQMMRLKESADDYRYFPEPDLLPIVLTDEYIESIRSKLPELPYKRNIRYIKELKLSHKNAEFLTNDKTLADYFEEGLKYCKNAKSLCNWIIVEFSGRLKDTGKTILDTDISSKSIAELVNLIDDGTITGKIAKAVADDMMADSTKTALEIVKANPDYQPMDNHGELERFVDEAISKNHQAIVDYKNGRDRALGAIVGQVMKQTRGKASPKIVNKILLEKIENYEV